MQGSRRRRIKLLILPVPSTIIVIFEFAVMKLMVLFWLPCYTNFVELHLKKQKHIHDFPSLAMGGVSSEDG